jgi:hypothetical protein
MEEIPKPAELLGARDSAEALFRLLREWFDVPAHVMLDLRAVDSAVSELGDPQLVMAMAMRKLQALHLLTTPGVRTTTDVVLTVIQDLERALLQAPNMHLKKTAEATDWDAALVALDGEMGSLQAAGQAAADAGGDAEEGLGQDAGEGAGEGAGEPDEIDVFRHHHARLHEAARAVLHVSEGQIRTLV